MSEASSSMRDRDTWVKLLKTLGRKLKLFSSVIFFNRNRVWIAGVRCEKGYMSNFEKEDKRTHLKIPCRQKDPGTRIKDQRSRIRDQGSDGRWKNNDLDLNKQGPWALTQSCRKKKTLHDEAINIGVKKFILKIIWIMRLFTENAKRCGPFHHHYIWKKASKYLNGHAGREYVFAM